MFIQIYSERTGTRLHGNYFMVHALGVACSVLLGDGYTHRFEKFQGLFLITDQNSDNSWWHDPEEYNEEAGFANRLKENHPIEENLQNDR